MALGPSTMRSPVRANGLGSVLAQPILKIKPANAASNPALRNRLAKHSSRASCLTGRDSAKSGSSGVLCSKATALDVLPIRGIFQALLLHLGRVLPNDFARPGIDQLESVEHVIARPRTRLGGQALQFAGQEKVRALEFHQVRVGAGRDLAGLLELALMFQGGHALPRQ